MHKMIEKKPRAHERRGLSLQRSLRGAAKFKERLFVFPAVAIVVAAWVLTCRRLCRLVVLRFRRTQDNFAVDLHHGRRAGQDDKGMIRMIFLEVVLCSPECFPQTRSARTRSLCVPKTLSALISRRNHLTSVDHVRTILLRPGRFGLAVQVEEPT